MLRRLATTAGLTLALLAPVAAASAQTASYPGNPPSEILGTGDDRGDAAVAGVTATRPEARAATSGGNLAVTGSDLAQLAVVGVVLVGGGTVLVRRGRRQPVTA